MTVEELKIIISANNSDFRSKIKSAQSDMNGFSSAAGRMSDSFSSACDRINSILNNTERSLKSKAAGIAAVLKNEGMSSSEAFTQAWSMIERGSVKVDDFTDSVKKSDSVLGSFFDKIKQGVTQLNNFGKQTDEASKKTEKLGKTAQQATQSAMSSFRSLAAGITALGLGRIIKSSIQEAMDAVESENLFETSLGEYAESARAWSEKLESSLGLNAVELRKNSGVLYTMIRSMGLTEQQAYKLSTGLTELSEDVASFYNISSEEAFLKIRTGLTGETEPLKALGILVDENTVKQYAYAAGIAEAGQELTVQQKVLARYQAIMAQTVTAQGDLARTIDSPANQLRLLQNEITKAKISAGTALLPLVQTVLPMLTSGLQRVTPYITNFANKISAAGQYIAGLNPVSKAFLKLMLASAIAVPAVTLAVKGLTVAKTALHAIQALLIPQTITLGTVMKSAFGWIALAAGAIALITSLGGSDTSGFKNIDSAADGAGASLDTLTGSLDSTDSLTSDTAANVADLADEIDNLSDAASNLSGFDEINILDSENGTIMSKLVSSADISNLDGFADGLKDITDDIYAVQQKAGKGINLEANVFTDEFVQKLDSAEKAVERIFGPGWTSFWEDVGEAMYDGIKEGNWLPLLEKLNEGVEEIFGPGWTSFWEDVGGDMYTGINEGDWYPLLENLEKKTEMLFGPGWTSFWEGVGANWNGFWEDRGEDAYDLLDGAWEDIKWAAKKDWENIKGGFSDWNRFWQDKGEKLFDLLDGAWEDIKRAAKKDWENIKEGFSDWNSFWQDKGEKLYDVLNPDDIGEAGGSAMSAIATAIDDGIPEVTESMNKALSLGEEFAVQFMNIYNDAVPQYQQMANGISIAAGMGMSTVGINYVSYTAKGRRINAYANGGFPDYGELFIANENGPELVGQIGSRTAVANQGQITDAIYMAVLDAMRMSGKNTSQGQGDVHVYIDSDEVSARVEQRQYARSKRLGG